VWSFIFALFSAPQWDFSANTLTLPVDDISLIGHFNNADTMGFGNVVGISMRGQIVLAPSGVSYTFNAYLLLPKSDVQIGTFASPTLVANVNSEADRKSAGSSSFAATDFLEVLAISPRLLENDSPITVVRKLRQAIEAAAPEFAT